MNAPLRKRTNITVDADLLKAARDLGINVSRAAERALAEDVRKAEGARWLEENREAIESSNEWVRKNGLPLAKYRQF